MTKGKEPSYWQHVIDTIRSLSSGLKITFAHLRQARKTQPVRAISAPNYFSEREGIATIQYPYAMQPVPDNGRYRLHNEIDDCIVCDKCAKVCPVDCITIEPIRATEEIGRTSDGTSKRIYAATFDIDMGKCCFCGLCTTVCPTECLTMTKVYDFSVTDIREHNFVFAEMTEAEIAEKKKLFEEHQKSKAVAAATPPAPTATIVGTPEEKKDNGDAAVAPAAPKVSKPVFKPKIKPPGSSTPTS
ncbi:4Fe-4S binding protein [Chryseolinea lacunae]|uniref:4Fe-4S binding protein n=1 Tax=Chryseolinea lacunae TaxID=2801331 RepID=A0ABS1KSW2_9BACT|nr:4Fe-4S binding protein [Chryseolinea lacunae]MBL0742544.1 4Fe-4S binding protein [Chryseolinea lacunae]